MPQLSDIFNSIEIKKADTHPYFFHLDRMECFHSNRPFHIEHVVMPDAAVLIHVSSGQLTVQLHTPSEKTADITKDMFLFLNPGSGFSVSSDTAGTALNIIIFHGVLLSEYVTPEILSSGYSVIEHAFPGFSDSFFHIVRDFSETAPSGVTVFDTSDSDMKSFLVHQYLTELMTAFHKTMLLPANQRPKLVPAYLTKVRRHFEEHYALSFVLDDVVEWHGVSKYKFCHDFKQFYGQAPLQFLNELRIRHAKELLVTTNIPVHEVGSAVGIDNTNHFINLFKRFTGVTPLQFRKNNT